MKNYEKFTGGKIKNIIEDLSKYYKENEVFYKMGRSKAAFYSVKAGVENSWSEENGIAIRFWKNKGPEYFFHSSYDVSGGLQKDLVNRLESLSYATGENYSPHLAGRQIQVSELDIFCRETAEASSELLYNLLIDTIQHLEEEWKGVIKVNNGELRAGFSQNWLSNSKGFSDSFQRTMASISLNFQVIQRNKEKKTYSNGHIQSFYITFADSSILKIDPAMILKDYESIKDRSIDSDSHKMAENIEKDYKVVFSSQASSQLLGLLFEIFQGTQNFPIILSDKLTIVDDGKLMGGLSSAPFDGAGFPSKRTVIIQNGRHVKWFENIIRPSYRDYPRLGPTNLFIEPGGKSQEEIVTHVGKGVFVVSLKAFKNPSAESKASLLCQAFLIEEGKISQIGGKFIIATEVEEIFRNILEIGDDLQFVPWTGAYGAPTILTEKVSLIPFN